MQTVNNDLVARFRTAVINGDLPTVESLFNEAPTDVQPTLLEADNFYTLQQACQKGHQPILAFLWDKTSETQRGKFFSIKENDFYAFQGAYVLGHSAVVEFLWSNTSPDQQYDMMDAGNAYIFREACKKGDKDRVEFFWGKSVGVVKDRFRLFLSQYPQFSALYEQEPSVLSVTFTQEPSLPPQNVVVPSPTYQGGLNSFVQCLASFFCCCTSSPKKQASTTAENLSGRGSLPSRSLN